jgi:hypothetical protein
MGREIDREGAPDAGSIRTSLLERAKQVVGSIRPPHCDDPVRP